MLEIPYSHLTVIFLAVGGKEEARLVEEGD